MPQDRFWEAARSPGAGLPVTIVAAILLSACASNTYMGIPLSGGEATSPLQELAVRAQAGDKQAQLELGIAFEEGRGVPRDLGKAERLYRQAATDSGGSLWMYLPPTSKGTSGRVTTVVNEIRRVGLIEAQDRLIRLRQASEISIERDGK